MLLIYGTMDSIKKYPLDVSINMPAPAGSVMGKQNCIQISTVTIPICSPKGDKMSKARLSSGLLEIHGETYACSFGREKSNRDFGENPGHFWERLGDWAWRCANFWSHGCCTHRFHLLIWIIFLCQQSFLNGVRAAHLIWG